MSTSSSNTLTSMGFTSSRSLDDPSVVSLQTDKRLTRFFSSDKSPRKKLRTAIEFCKSSEREERERFFGGYKDEVWKTVLSTVEQYEKLKMDEWSNEDQGSTGFMSKFGLKKNIGVPDWLDVFKIIDELFEHCAPSIAFNGWENNTILDLLQKLLHPQNMHSIRLPALKLLLNYTTTLSDHSESDDHINLLKASCLGGLESLIDMSSSKPGQPGQVFTPKSNITSTPQPPPSQSPYLKELKFTCWNNQPMECLKSENSLTLEDHLAMLAEVLKFSVSSRATEGKRHDSIGGQQDSNMTLLFWSNLLCTHIFPVLLPQALPTSSTQPYEVPEMSKNLQTAPYRVLQILEKWTDELVQEGGSALDIFWSDGNNGKIIYECFRQRLDHLSDPVRHEMALRTLKKYLTLVETTSSSTTSSAPKHILKASGDACVTFAGHVCSLLIDPSDILSSEKFEEIIHLCVGLFEYPLRAPTLSPSKGVVLQDLLLNVITAQCSSAKLGSSSGKKEISMEFLTRLVRALFKVNAINNAVNDTPDDGGPQARTKQIVREWIKTNQDSRGFAISVVMEWRQTLLDLNKFVIYNVAIGDDATIDIIKKNSRWQVEGGKWLKSASALEALNVLRRHLNILDPKVTEDLAPKLHLLGLRSVADTVRQWVNEAIIPDRHYRPPPKKGSDKVARNESKERAKAEEFDLTSPLTRIGPMTVANLFGAWLFKGAEKEGTDFKEGRMVALESLMKLMCARTFTHVDVSVERRILKLVRKALLEEDKGALLIILRVMGDLFLSEIPGVCGLVAPFLSLSEQLLPGVGESTIFLGNQSKTALMQALCCIVTLLGKFGHLKSGPEDDAVLLSSFGTRLGDIFIHFMDGATSNEDGCDWVRTCASGLFFLMTEELWKQEGGAEIDDFNIRHWVNTLCEWCNNASDNVAFASMSCLHDLSQLYPHLGGDDLDLHHTLILNLCGSTWQMIRNVYNTAHEELTKAHLGQQQKGKAGSGRNIRGGGGVGGGGSRKLSKRIVCALNCISDWVMYNPTQFLLHEDACMKFFDVLEAAAMGKLPLRMDQHLEKKGNVVVPVFPEISEAAEDIITHLLNLLNREEDYKNVDLSHPGRFDLQVDENDPSQGEKDTSVFFSYLDSMLISLVHNSKEGEGVVVVRDSSGAYTWRSTVETIGRAQVEPTLLKSIIRRRSTNKSYNKSLYEADLRGSADDHSEHKGPACRSSGSGCTSVRFGDGVKDSDGDGEQAALDRKALLLARVNSRGKAKKSSMAGTFFEDFDLKSDPLKDALSTMEVFEVDDPTLLGNKFAIEKEFSGDLSTGSAGDSARIRPVESVLRILNDDVVSKLLQKFLKKEVALESYNFYVEVNEFKAGSAGVTGQSIFDKYVKEGSDEQINIPSGMMTEIKKCLEEGGGVFGSETFDAAVNEVVTMLARDKLPRFLNSDGVVERKDLYERCVKLAMRVEDGEKKAEGKMGGGGSPKRGEKKVPMVARQDAESMLSAGIDDALLGNVTRLFASQIGLLQPYDNDLFKVLRVTKDDDKKFKTFVRNLQHLDITRSRETVKIGVLYVGNGQTNQKEVLANQKGSVMYEEFIGGLGSLVDLKTHKGFTGKLDTKYYSNGRYLTYHSTSTTETAFHISTQMPTALNDPQQVKKKRHISNDHVQIVWSDNDRDYLPCTLTSEFNDVIISLYPLKRGNRSDLLRCKITAKEGIPYFGPLTDGMIIRAGVAPKLVRLTAINANRVVREAQGEEMNRPHVERRKIIKQLVDVYGEDYKGGEVFESLCRIVR
ncbi:hypothetical protein TL16_g10771 [Triparma laevis f. inornata]|uniref:Rap-GAP domain-containing protein n=1 Tax=Triparma laevis f. inornata TaxID=1714386 RepID=A0A9W7BJ91_9STRA|nr:hypothetical protein TL16_g10771 [Triparma laevis f. inornata]